uniref:Hic24 n=1 Tax=Sinohyriopsis cumingii TaxID=165450 RepID=A0A7G3FWI8_SINCU|nr:hic24 [Sinohyriopsis cumingii]
MKGIIFFAVTSFLAGVQATGIPTARKELEADIGEHKGYSSTYVRWGRTKCRGDDTELVYKGFAGGSHYTQYGGAADFLCLPEVPTWGTNIAAVYMGLIYGAEYELTSGHHPFSTVSANDDVPCSVCRTPRATTIMIPAKSNCYQGWIQEYTGYLMSGYYGHAGPTNYVCVDARPEAVFRGSPDHNGHLMYMVQASCGSLPCPPYVEGRVIACVVCSK